MSYAKSGNGLVTFAQEYHTFLDAYAKDRSILRWRLSDYNTHRIGVMLDGAEYPKRNFVAQPDLLRQCKMFITQDEIDHFFLGGGADSKLAVYAHFCYPHTPEERQKFIKNYFGEYSGGACDCYDHTQTRMELILVLLDVPGKGLYNSPIHFLFRYHAVGQLLPSSKPVNVTATIIHLLSRPKSLIKLRQQHQ